MHLHFVPQLDLVGNLAPKEVPCLLLRVKVVPLGVLVLVFVKRVKVTSCVLPVLVVVVVSILGVVWLVLLLKVALLATLVLVKSLLKRNLWL